MEHDPIFRNTLAWNEVTKRVEVRATSGPLARYAGALPIEAVTTGIQDLLASGWDLALPYQDVARRVVSIARSRPFDPLADYLQSIRWDGTPRIGSADQVSWLSAYCGAEDIPYTREVARRWLLALVARGLKPGTKVDNVLVLEGAPALGKCLGRGTQVIMYDGTVKAVEQVVDGDLVMGPDSKPRRVFGVMSGHGPLKRIVPNKGDAWVCNDKHVLTVFSHSNQKLIDVPVTDCYSRIQGSSWATFLRGKAENFKTSARIRGATKTAVIRGIGVDAVRDLHTRGHSFNEIAFAFSTTTGAVRNAINRQYDYSAKPSEFVKSGQVVQERVGVDFLPQDVPVDPYWTGLWLGDGTIGKPQITTADKEIIDYCHDFARRGDYGMTDNLVRGREHIHYITYTTGTKRGQARAGRNALLNFIESLVVNGEKRIPSKYLINDKRVRLEILAGLIDTDGYCVQGCCVITTKFVGLRDDILYLARSLGFAANWCEKKVKKYLRNTYYNVVISGDLQEVPCRLPRKQMKPRTTHKNHHHTGFKIEDVGDGEYFGFQVTGDGRFLLGDFTVTHNSSVFEIIGGEWFCDTAVVLGDKDSQMLAGRYWICELAEMVSIKKTGQDALKHFFSSRVDKFRPPYAASYEDFPRRCLFVGTINPPEGGGATYLTDETGNRKYWAVAVKFVEHALTCLRRDRDQLIAEAVTLYRAAAGCSDCQVLGDRCSVHRWWFAYEEIAITEVEAEKRLVETPAKLKIESWWYGLEPSERPDGFTTMDVAETAMEKAPGDVHEGHLRSIGIALAKMGFRRGRDTTGSRAWRYFATDELKAVPRRTNGVHKKGSLFALPPLSVAPVVGGGSHHG